MHPSIMVAQTVLEYLKMKDPTAGKIDGVYLLQLLAAKG